FGYGKAREVPVAIQKSMEQYGIAASSVTAFLSQEVGQLSGTDEEKFQQIITQKFIALFYQGYEAYAEFRRTGYPKVWLGTLTGATDHIPRRLTYPTAEYLINEKNLSEAIARMGEDTYETRIWWDVRPGLPFRHPLQDVFPPN
ncbi:MAG: SusD/RagB family nutrient-binding outer membrane lipoprotein, partial [Paludibacter sp.]